jgi:hypothetical protein
MAADETMSIHERDKYLRKMQKRYRIASRRTRGKLLDEMQAVTELHRKSLIRLMGSRIQRKHRKRQRCRTYGPQVEHALQVISESLDHVCAERLKPNLVWMAQHLAQHAELEISTRLLEKLERISVSTVRRLLEHAPRDRPRLPRKGPARANRLAREIPARRIPWQEQEPGHLETDLVHHCGLSASGHYVHTLQMIDVATGWSERAAILGRSHLVVRDAFCRFLARLPFPVLEVHPDNGSEFLNYHLRRFWKEAGENIELSRSRAWQKNDNRFVEQKNDTLVRAYLGYDRLDTVEQTILLNQLYDRMWLYYNFFQPVMRLQEKVVVPQPGRHSRIKRRFDKAQTPFDRLCASGALDQDRKKQFQQLRRSTNPRQLREEIYALLDKFFDLPNAAQGSTQDVYLTLFEQPHLEKEHAISVTISNDRTIPVR